MDKELARITAKLYSEAAERMLVAAQMLGINNIVVCGPDRVNEVHICEDEFTARIDEFAEALGETAVKFREDEDDEYWGFIHDRIKYFTMRDKKGVNEE